MHFRVAAVQDSGLPDSFDEARLWLEDWLNQTLGEVDFGCPSCRIMIVVFATSSLTKVPPISRLSNGGSEGPILAIHVVIAPELVGASGASNHLNLLCGKIVKTLPVKPLRKPKELDYVRLRLALLSCIQPFASCAA
jgi:hypothetical protein